MTKSRKQLMKERRQNALQFLLSLILLFFSFNYYLKVNTELTERIIMERKEISLIEEQLLIRKKWFYSDNTYLEKYTLVKKEWSDKSIGGVEFNEYNEKKH